MLAAHATHRLEVARGRQHHPASALERLSDESCHLRRASRSLDGVLELGRKPLNKVGLAFALTPLAVVRRARHVRRHEIERKALRGVYIR
jgi:hypothetical protein